MLTTTGTKIKFDLAIAISASLVFVTRVIDEIIMFIARPYLLNFLNDVKAQKVKDPMRVTSVAGWVLGYPILVFHLLIIILAVIVFLNKKYKPYKRELLCAYLIVAIGDVLMTIALRSMHTT